MTASCCSSWHLSCCFTPPWKDAAVRVARVKVHCSNRCLLLAPVTSIPCPYSLILHPSRENWANFQSLDFQEQMTTMYLAHSWVDKKKTKWNFLLIYQHFSCLFFSLNFYQYILMCAEYEIKNSLNIKVNMVSESLFDCRVPSSICCGLGCGTSNSGWCKVSEKGEVKRELQIFSRLCLPAWNWHLPLLLITCPLRDVM